MTRKSFSLELCSSDKKVKSAVILEGKSLMKKRAC